MPKRLRSALKRKYKSALSFVRRYSVGSGKQERERGGESSTESPGAQTTESESESPIESPAVQTPESEPPAVQSESESSTESPAVQTPVSEPSVVETPAQEHKQQEKAQPRRAKGGGTTAFYYDPSAMLGPPYGTSMVGAPWASAMGMTMRV